MEHKIVTTIWLHIWDGGLGKVFLEINKPELAQIRRHYGDYCQVNYFAGKIATVVTVADSRYTSRGECLEVATKRVNGQYKVYSIDLNRCDVRCHDGVAVFQNPR